MGKLAVLFPGQGSQKVGMGSDLLEARPELFERYMDQADAASGLPVRERCLEGPIEELTRTDVAQPALFALSLALMEVAREAGIEPDFVAGHSLGEYTAAVAAGVLSVDEGMGLVAERGRLMAESQSKQPGTMAAIIGLPIERLEELCREAADVGLVSPANLNTPTQIVVSGEEAAVVRLMELAEAAEAERVVRLQVGAAFHSALMKPTQSALSEKMQSLTWNDPEPPLIGNASGEVKSDATAVREALVAQIASPVLWVDCVRRLGDEGCTSFLEVGSGRVLSGLVRQINPDAETFAADSPKKLEKFLARA
jgi:[acyl-carrier-protein] S-malonyltransferase